MLSSSGNWTRIGTVWMVLIGLLSHLPKPVNAADREHPLAPALRLAKASLRDMETIPGYEADFHKVEMIGRRATAQDMKVKLREEPFSVYLSYVKPHEGREVLYVKGRNKGRLLAHEGGVKGLVGSISLLPTSRDAMAGNRYPITQIGMSNMLRAVIAQWESELEFGEVEVKFYPNSRVDDRPCKVIETIHPRPRKQFRFHKTQLFIDKQTNLPIRVRQFGFPRREKQKAPVVEDYIYRNIRVDVKLRDADFDPRNPSYSF